MSKLLERLDKLEKAATPGPWLDACILVETEEQKDMASYWGCPNANLAVALRNAYPKLRAVIEAAEKLSETCRDILPGGSAEAIGDFYGDTYELADALAALEEDV